MDATFHNCLVRGDFDGIVSLELKASREGIIIPHGTRFQMLVGLCSSSSHFSDSATLARRLVKSLHLRPVPMIIHLLEARHRSLYLELEVAPSPWDTVHSLEEILRPWIKKNKLA